MYDSAWMTVKADGSVVLVELFILPFKVVIITNLEQKQKSAYNAENKTDLPKTLQVPSLCCFS